MTVNVTLIEEEIADKMGIQGKICPLEMGWTQNVTSRDETSRKVQFKISGKVNSKKYDITNARTVKKLALPNQNINLHEVARHFTYLKDADLPDLTEAIPTVLIE